MKKNNAKKNFLWNLIGVSFNSFNSLFLLMIINNINTKAEAGIFTFAFSLMSMFYILAIYFTRVYQISNNEDYDDKVFINTRFITSFLTLIIVILLSVVSGYSFYKFIIILLLCLYRICEAISDIFYGILQKYNQLYKSGISLSIKALLGLVLFFIIDYFSHNLIFSCIGIIFINILVFFIYDLPSTKKFISFKNENYISIKQVKDILIKSFFVFLVAFLSIYLVNFSKYTLDYFESAEVQNIFGIILMPATIMSLCAQYVLNPFINILNEYKNNKEYLKLCKAVKKIILILFILGLLILIGAYFLGIPLLNILYTIKLDEYKIDLLYIIIGSIFYAVANIYSQILVLLNKTKAQAILYIIVSLVGLLLSIILIDNLKLRGASLSYLIVMVILYILYYTIYKISIIRSKS